MPIKLNTASGGGVILQGANTAVDTTITVPAATGNMQLIQQATAVTASGTSVDFTGIPSWVKRITVMFNGVSTNGTSIPQVQLGTSGGVETTSYLAMVASTQTTANTTRGVTSTTGFYINPATDATFANQGFITFVLLGSNTWVCSGSVYTTGSTISSNFVSGSKTLSGTLDRVRITTVNGTDTFDAGTINIMYEG